jgi:hypothetical protein
MVSPRDILSHATIDYCDIRTQNGRIVCPPQNVDVLSHANVTTTASIRPSDNMSIRQFVHPRFHIIFTVPSRFLLCALTYPNPGYGQSHKTEVYLPMD